MIYLSPTLLNQFDLLSVDLMLRLRPALDDSAS